MPAEQQGPSTIGRTPRREDAFFVPQPVEGEPGRFVVDATWGRINSIQIAPGVRTVGELEVIAHIEAGLPLVDSRREEYFTAGSIPRATSIPHEGTAQRMIEFDTQRPTVLFCNGPQCSATPHAIKTLLEAGHPAELLLYYRGGIHDWLTLGLPAEPGAAPADAP